MAERNIYKKEKMRDIDLALELEDVTDEYEWLVVNLAKWLVVQWVGPWDSWMVAQKVVK